MKRLGQELHIVCWLLAVYPNLNTDCRFVPFTWEQAQGPGQEQVHQKMGIQHHRRKRLVRNSSGSQQWSWNPLTRSLMIWEAQCGKTSSTSRVMKRITGRIEQLRTQNIERHTTHMFRFNTRLVGCGSYKALVMEGARRVKGISATQKKNLLCMEMEGILKDRILRAERYGDFGLRTRRGYSDVGGCSQFCQGIG